MYCVGMHGLQAGSQVRAALRAQVQHQLVFHTLLSQLLLTLSFKRPIMWETHTIVTKDSSNKYKI